MRTKHRKNSNFTDAQRVRHLQSGSFDLRLIPHTYPIAQKPTFAGQRHIGRHGDAERKCNMRCHHMCGAETVASDRSQRIVSM